MLRYYFSSSDLKEIESVEVELEEDGFSRNHIHVLSDNQTELDKRRIHGVPSLFRSDGLHWAERGVLLGALVSSILVLALSLGGAQEMVGWPMIIALAMLVMGAITWEAGLIGMQRVNYKFARFDDELKQGKHVMMVDVDESEVHSLCEHMKGHPKMAWVGSGSSYVNPFANQDSFSNKDSLY